VHVAERGAFSWNLSLAQIAALGATVAHLIPFSNGDPHAPAVDGVSLLLTFIDAFVVAMFRVKRARIPQEAIISILTAVEQTRRLLAELPRQRSSGARGHPFFITGSK